MKKSIGLSGLALAALAVIAAALSGIHSTPAPRTVRRTAASVTNAAYPTGESLRQQFPKLPITFEENHGQTNKDVRYLAQGPHYAFYLTQNEVRLSLTKASNKGVVLGLRFLGANPSATITGAERAPGNVNYLRGNDPADWHTDVPTYSRVVYHDLWPNVDLSLRANNGALTYEFRVRREDSIAHDLGWWSEQPPLRRPNISQEPQNSSGQALDPRIAGGKGI